MELTDRGANVGAALEAEDAFSNGEIVLIGHSLGGLVIKQALRFLELKSIASPTPALLERVTKVAFIATPHSGSDLANVEGILKIIARPTPVIKNLRKNNRQIAELNHWYRMWSLGRIEHLVMYETMPVKVGILRLSFVFVGANSADPGVYTSPIPVDSNHMNITKIKSKENYVYLQLRRWLRQAGVASLPVRLPLLAQWRDAIVLRAKEAMETNKNLEPDPKAVALGLDA